jgi:UDP-N-acetylglucosamine--N-acetylmuramyl-(pentapeptide) pyrophosphoryl-undecaprenol N-acetylglucosamine transferase
MKNLTFLPLLSGKWRREKGLEAFLKNIGDLFKFTIGILQSLVYLLRFRIDVVFCKGGYVALPVVVAAWILRKKILVHESDTRA